MYFIRTGQKTKQNKTKLNKTKQQQQQQQQNKKNTLSSTSCDHNFSHLQKCIGEYPFTLIDVRDDMNNDHKRTTNMPIHGVARLTEVMKSLFFLFQ